MPVLTAAKAGVRHRRRWLFRDLDVSVEPGEIVAIVGPPGSGRTTVLLALSHRFKLSAGRVTGSAALGWVPDVTSPEPVLTVLEHVRERLLLTGRSPREADLVPLLGLDPGARGFELSPYQRQVLGLVLARMEKPRVIALDAVDEGLDAGETRQVWDLIGSIAGEGIAVLVTAREVDPDRVSTVVRLGGAPTATDAGVTAATQPEDNELVRAGAPTEDGPVEDDKPVQDQQAAEDDVPMQGKEPVRDDVPVEGEKRVGSDAHADRDAREGEKS